MEISVVIVLSRSHPMSNLTNEYNCIKKHKINLTFDEFTAFYHGLKGRHPFIRMICSGEKSLEIRVNVNDFFKDQNKWNKPIAIVESKNSSTRIKNAFGDFPDLHGFMYMRNKDIIKNDEDYAELRPLHRLQGPRIPRKQSDKPITLEKFNDLNYDWDQEIKAKHVLIFDSVEN